MKISGNNNEIEIHVKGGFSERKGIVQAIVGLSYLVGKQEELI